MYPWLGEVEGTSLAMTQAPGLHQSRTDVGEASFDDSPHKATTPIQNKTELTPNPVREKVGPTRANLHPWGLIDGPT